MISSTMNKRIIFLVMLLLMSGCSGSKKSSALKAGLTPWLAVNGKFGYVDSTGNMVIQPQYDDAKLFHNGFAVVGKSGGYGVINGQNKVVIPLKYAVAKIIAQNKATLVVTKKEYNAWWQFWNWRIMPDFNILSTSNDGPFLVTKVPKAKWVVRSLPSRETLFSNRRLDERSAMEPANIGKTAGRLPVLFLTSLTSPRHER